MDSQFLGLSAPDSDCLSWQGHIWLSMPMEVNEKNGDLSWNDFVEALLEGFLPHDDVQRTPFDQTLHFELGDPHATGGGRTRSYETSDEVGGPNWVLLFKYLLQHCRHIQHYDAVYILVDTRDLTKVATKETTLAHWPAVAAWWSSRLHYVGPGDEQVIEGLLQERGHITNGACLSDPRRIFRLLHVGCPCPF